MTLVGIHASHEQLPPSRLLDAVRHAGADAPDLVRPVCQGPLGPSLFAHRWDWQGSAVVAVHSLSGSKAGAS